MALPPYVVPSAVVVLNNLPLTLNGKIDREALPAPDADAHAGGDLVAPRTSTERRIAALWEEIRGTAVGVTDDVFELGVGSLTVARLYTRIAMDLGVDLSVGAAFRAPTIEQVAALVDQLRDGSSDTGNLRALVAIAPEGTRRPLFLVHGGAGTVLLFEPLARLMDRDQPVYALQASGLYGRHAPQRSVIKMAQLYIKEIRSIQARGPYRLGGYCFGALVAYEMARQFEEAGEVTELLIAFNGSSPSYIRTFNPLFDANGALTDETGQLVHQQRGVLALVNAAWRQRESPAAFARTLTRHTLGLVRGRAGRMRYRVRLHGAVVFGRPLPDHLREVGVFQVLAMYAQNRYDAVGYSGDMVVVRAEALYHRDDLGWSDHVGGNVEVIEVPGSQLTPRDSMKTAFVPPIAAAVSARLAAADRAG